MSNNCQFLFTCSFRTFIRRLRCFSA